MAASATFALKAGVWFRRGRLVMVSPDSQGTACPLSGRNSTYRPVQISGTGSEIVLLSADGVGTNEIMRRTGKSKTCVWRWQERFMRSGYDGLLHDKTRRSRIPPLGTNITERVVALTQTEPPAEATHWTSAMMAKVVDISASSVQRIWRAHGLQPHRVKQFKLSTDPQFVDKLRDIVGLYVDPPAHAVVLSVDEKSQIQALDRTQPGLPMKPGRAGTMTHDYKRHGTTTLFAALNVLTGVILGKCLPRHRNVPAWLATHPRFHIHFVPTSSSWLNLVERWFRELTTKRLRRGSFASVPELVAAIEDYIANHNDDPKPFLWTKTPDKTI